MKVYINNLNLDAIGHIKKILDNYIVSDEEYIDVYTNESIYRINQDKIFILKPVDGGIEILNKFYEDFTLIIDHSRYDKELYNKGSIIGEKITYLKIRKTIYKINKTSEISFIIEDIDNSCNNRYPRYDVYFEIGINGPFNISAYGKFKEELIEFLSLLN